MIIIMRHAILPLCAMDYYTTLVWCGLAHHHGSRRYLRSDNADIPAFPPPGDSGKRIEELQDFFGEELAPYL